MWLRDESLCQSIPLQITLTVCFQPIYILTFKSQPQNKRAQRALGCSPEEKVKGHSGANNREPQGHNLNNYGRGPLDDAIYQI